jgi:hypothetical protein
MTMRRVWIAAVLSGLMGASGCVAEGVDALDDEEVATTQAAVNEHIHVKIFNSFFDRMVEEVVTQEAIEGRVEWEPGADRVAVRRRDSDTFNVDLDMRYKFEPWNPDVDADFRLSISCNWREPNIKLAMTDSSANVHWPVSATILIPSLSAVGNQIADNIADDKIKKALKKKFLEKLDVDISDLGGFCPRINILDNGDLDLDFGRGSQCVENRVKHEACPDEDAPLGPGLRYLCVNGYWEFDYSECGNCHPGETRTLRCPGGNGNIASRCGSDFRWHDSGICQDPAPPEGGSQL